MSEEWLEQRACRHLSPKVFFPERGDHASVVLAKAACAACPVTAECLDMSFRFGEQDGIWGGLTPRQRRRVRVTVSIRKVCRQCGDPFSVPPSSGRRGTTRYCSEECRRSARSDAQRRYEGRVA